MRHQLQRENVTACKSAVLHQTLLCQRPDSAQKQCYKKARKKCHGLQKILEHVFGDFPSELPCVYKIQRILCMANVQPRANFLFLDSGLFDADRPHANAPRKMQTNRLEGTEVASGSSQRAFRTFREQATMFVCRKLKPRRLLLHLSDPALACVRSARNAKHIPKMFGSSAKYLSELLKAVLRQIRKRLKHNVC